MAQTDENWLSYFEDNDQHAINELTKDISQFDTEIFMVTNTFEYDSINKLFNLNLIQPTFNSSLKSKSTKQYDLIDIYDKYLENGIKYIDSVPDYKISLEYSYKNAQEAISKLNTLAIDDISQLAESKSLLNINQTQEIIISNQKQFFTFFSIAGKAYLLSGKNINSSANKESSIVKPVSGNEENIKYANVIINDEIVESIQVSIQNYKEDPNSIYSISNFDIDNLNKVWNKYIYNEDQEPEPTPKKNNTSTELTDSLPLVTDSIIPKNNFTKEPESNELADTKLSDTKNESTPNEPTDNVLITDNLNSDSNPPDENYINNKTSEEKTIEEKTETKSYPAVETNNNFSDGLVYRVQIAADRVPLTPKKLARRYKGERSINMFQEEGWYKYYIAETKTLKQAIFIRKEIGVPDDAFIMAYKDGVKVMYYLKYQTLNAGSKPPDSFIDLKSLSENRVVIVVQVAADREPLSEERLSELYQGGKPLNYIFEDGWHKYSFGNYKKFWPANFARRKCGTDGAFVVAYKNGIKIDLWKDNKEK